MFKPLKHALAALAALLIMACAPAGQAANFLWKVAANGQQAFILGSMHLAKADLYPLESAIEQAFASSHYLVVEADVTASQEQALALAPLVVGAGQYQDGRTIKTTLSRTTLNLLEQAGYKPESFGAQKPWLIAVSLQMKSLSGLGFSPEYGLDRYFLQRAKNHDRPIFELEGLAAQLQMFASMNDVDQDLFLRTTLYEANKLPQTLGRIYQAWISGDVRTMEAVLFQDYNEHPELHPIAERLFFQRNITMETSITQFIQGSPGQIGFFVVGSGHLVGRDNILSRLKNRGYAIEQL